MFACNLRKLNHTIYGYSLLEFLLSSTLMVGLLTVSLYVCSDLNTSRRSLHHIYQINDRERVLSLNLLMMLNQYRQMDESYRQAHPIQIMPELSAPDFIHASLVKESDIIILPIDTPFISHDKCATVALYVAYSSAGIANLYLKCPGQRAEVLSSNVQMMKFGLAKYQSSGDYQLHTMIDHMMMLKPNDLLITHFLMDEVMGKVFEHQYYFFYKVHHVKDNKMYQDLPVFWRLES